MKSLTEQPPAPRDNVASRLLKRLPGGEFAQKQIDRVEKRLLQELKTRLDAVTPQSTVNVLAVSMQVPKSERGSASHVTLGTRMQQLLAASTEWSREQSETAFFDAVLNALLPDHARILAALSDGSTYPMLHILGGPRFGLGLEPVLECVSSVGKNAGVLLPEATHVYVQQLRATSSTPLSTRPKARKVQYEMLETDTLVRETLSRLTKQGYRTAIARRTLQLAGLGQRLWQATRVGEDS
jgi:hypothetical protein